jgi:hypothetical protein
MATRSNHQISFMRTCQALLEVDKNSLVLAHGLPQCNIRSLIVETTRKEGGSADYLCEDIPAIASIEDDVAFGQVRKTDPPTMRVASMAVEYGMKNVCRVPSWQATLYLKSNAV